MAPLIPPCAPEPEWQTWRTDLMPADGTAGQTHMAGQALARMNEKPSDVPVAAGRKGFKAELDALWADRQLALLCPQYEGRWDIWYVPVHPVGYHWCARPAGARTSTITVGTPEDLVAEIRRQEQSLARGRDFSDLPTIELERAHRDLAISAALAVPSSGAYLMTVTQMQAIDAELGARRRAAGSQSEGVL